MLCLSNSIAEYDSLFVKWYDELFIQLKNANFLLQILLAWFIIKIVAGHSAPVPLKEANYEIQEQKYLNSFEEYKNNVLIAEDNNTKEVIGYCCFSLEENELADSEIVSIYLNPNYTKNNNCINIS